jgi:DNA-binding response OmpR family regulator
MPRAATDRREHLMARRRILVVEDEEPIRRGVCDTLRMAGYDALEAADGVTGLTSARRTAVDLVLLDLALPRMDGFDVLTELRKTHPTLPVIVLTARGSESDRVRGLSQGADDYVVKPFSAKELLARVQAVLRRCPERPDPVQRIEGGGHAVDLDRCEARFSEGRVTPLSEMETEIFRHLAANPSRVVTREELLARVWGISDSKLETRAVDMHITRLRSKLQAGDADEPVTWITTVRGKGYMLGSGLHVVRRDTVGADGS